MYQVPSKMYDQLQAMALVHSLNAGVGWYHFAKAFHLKLFPYHLKLLTTPDLHTRQLAIIRNRLHVISPVHMSI